MFLPLGDSPNFHFTPWVTWGLIAANILVFFFCVPLSMTPADPADPEIAAYMRIISDETGKLPPPMSAYDGFVFLHGFKPAYPRLQDIFSAMFLHGGWLHLLGNMLFLWIYGDNVEYRLGRIGYLLAYLGSGTIAALADGLLRHGSAIPSVGASGAISGILGLYFIWFPENRVRVWIFFFPIFMDIVELPARLVLGVYLVIDNILPVLISSGSGGVAHGAHLGGFAAGAGLAFLMNLRLFKRPERDFRKAPFHGGPRGSLGAKLAEGDLVGAMDAFSRVPGRALPRNLDPGEGLRLARELESNGHIRSALSVYQRLASHHVDRGIRAVARLGQARILLHHLDLPTESYQQLAHAIQLGLPPEEDSEARKLLGELGKRGIIPRRV